MNLDQNDTMVIKHSAQGPLLLEDDNRGLRLLTTREEIVSKPLDPYTFLCYRIAFFNFTLYILLKNYYYQVKDKDYLLGHKGIIDTRRILIWRKVLGSRVCHGLTNFGLYCLTLFISCLLLLLLPKIPDRLD